MLIRAAREAGRKDRCAIAVMAKASIPGRTKTRLSPPLRPAEASELNTAFLLDIVGNLSAASESVDIATFMAFGPPGSSPFFEDHFPAHIGLMEIWYPNFGECLRQTTEAIFVLGYGAAVVLNSDSPTLPTRNLVMAAKALAEPGDRIVLGPSEDGGYYLLGMNRPHARLYADISWSTDSVKTQTLERAAELNLETVLLPSWYDVDDVASLRVVVRETLLERRFERGVRPYVARRTAATLRRMLRSEGFAERIDLSLGEGLAALRSA
jgi:rSAM/selenodomain-associated transferase 1